MDLRRDNLAEWCKVRMEVLVRPVDRHVKHKDVGTHGPNSARVARGGRDGQRDGGAAGARSPGHAHAAPAGGAPGGWAGGAAELGRLLPPRLLGGSVEVVGLALRRRELLPRCDRLRGCLEDCAVYLCYLLVGKLAVQRPSTAGKYLLAVEHGHSHGRLRLILVSHEGPTPISTHLVLHVKEVFDFALLVALTPQDILLYMIGDAP
mmetsp:Transcript_37045/g.115308  ORF Transcript_37045/g.115308 Transcript_37045/m.115308 type:complete len:206 (-) Transcript_37045:62-679(-)